MMLLPIPAPPHRGGCLCGAVRYRYDAAPIAVVACHCRDCQKLTGATNLLTIYADRTAFVHEQGELARYRKRADSGREADYSRCASCGTRVWHEPHSAPQWVFIAAGTLAGRPPIVLLREDNVRRGFFEETEFIAVRRRLAPDLADFVTFLHVTGWRWRSEAARLRWTESPSRRSCSEASRDVTVPRPPSSSGRVRPRIAVEPCRHPPRSSTTRPIRRSD